jgi:hypothetical protein
MLHIVQLHETDEAAGSDDGDPEKHGNGTGQFGAEG